MLNFLCICCDKEYEEFTFEAAYHVILVRSNSHELSLWENKRSHVFLAYFVNVHVLVSSIQYNMKPWLIFMHRV